MVDGLTRSEHGATTLMVCGPIVPSKSSVALVGSTQTPCAIRSYNEGE